MDNGFNDVYNVRNVLKVLSKIGFYGELALPIV